MREQFDQLEALGIAYDVCPGVSSFCGAAAALKAEYTLPDVSQTVIIGAQILRPQAAPHDDKGRLGQAVVFHGLSQRLHGAAALKAEYTLPDVSQTVIITRAAGRTPVPERE